MKIVSMVLVLALMVAAPLALLLPSTEALAARHEDGKTVYYCPMHPNYTADKPGSCPICGMDLVKKAPVKEGSAGVQIDLSKQQLIGVKTDEVKMRHLSIPLRASGRVVLDQELYDAQNEYVKAAVFLSKYWNAAYQRLLVLGMTEEEIKDLKNRRWADQGLIAIGPSDQGRFYRTPYPGSSWVYAAVFENEMALVKPGQSVRLTVSAFSGETWEGVVAGVAQNVDPQTRTARVRVRVEDKEKRLRPDMFVIVMLQVDLGEKLAVPATAVLDSGKRQIVYVVTGGTTFVPHEVLLGSRAGDLVEVKSGLTSGDKVVVDGNFLVDAESRLKAAF
ncbi:MAG: efflux RND transporter periplasmic adaptor subunit [Candidatus Omnitrophica bacterium]|nr:efflux RND transporter periplasmic adaptor subunit [Candidatus Omnitrophota bacterium]